MDSSESLENPNVDLKEVFKNSKGILVPGGFGSRGIEGKIKACEYARKNKVPYLGICLGMQVAVIEFARNVCNIKMPLHENLKNYAKILLLI